VNITKTRGFVLTVRNEGATIEDINIEIHVPNNVDLNANFSDPVVHLEPGNESQGNTYSLTDGLKRNEIIDYVFDYTPYDIDYIRGDGWGFDIWVQAFDREGEIVGNVTVEWSVSRWDI
jgi:hypothetical protein